MKRIYFIILLTFFVATGLTSKAQNEIQGVTAEKSNSNIHEQNYSVYLLLGNFDYTENLARNQHGWGRGYRPSPPKIDREGRELHNEYGFTNDLLDAMYSVLGDGRRTKTCDIQTEEELDNFLNGTDEDVFALEGVIEKLESATKYENDHSDQVRNYEGRVLVRFKIKDMRTKKVIHSFTKECTGTSSVRPTISEAMDRAISSLCGRLVVELNDIFPVYGSVVKIEEEKNGKAKSLYIDLGILDKVDSGSHFTIYSVENISGKEVRKKLGKVKVTKQQGDDISQCKVTSGGEEILSASKVGQKMIAVSYTGFWE